MSRNLAGRLALLVVPTLLFVPVALVFGTLTLDIRIARRFAFDPAAGDFIARHAVWANGILHGDGKILIWGIGLACLALGGAGHLLSSDGTPRCPGLYVVRRDLAWAFAGMTLIVIVIGILKRISNVDCPWSLTLFGGSKAYTGVFGARPPGMARGACFPGAHAGSGFALVAFHFAFRDSRPRLARGLLWAPAVVGTAFAVGQEARGAHFLSHDLWSAYLAWMLGACCWMMRTCWQGRVFLSPGAHRLAARPADVSNE